MRFCSGHRPLGLRFSRSMSIGSVESLVGDRGRQSQVVETAQHGVVPMPRVREVREPIRDDLSRPVGAVQPVREHELERARFGVAGTHAPERFLGRPRCEGSRAR